MKKSMLGAVLLSLVACDNGGGAAGTRPDASLPEVPAATGGATGSGGAAATGGTTGAAGAGGAVVATGGSRAGTGGASATAGTTGSASGGAIGSGGAVSTGGRTGTGGATSAGGTSGSSGGKSGTGGATATGGTAGTTTGGSGTGGRTGTGGVTAAGGVTGKGGTTAAGGASATGGSGAGWTAGPPETKPLGYGQGTTGCGSAATVTVASFAAAQAAVDAYAGSGGLCLKYTGTVDYAAIKDPCVQHTLPEQILQLKNVSDVTLLGADGSGANFGVHIASSSSNIIIRNMRFGLLPGGSASDAISIEGMSGGVPTNIWIDHNELWSSMVDCEGAGDTAFDGLIDLKKGADKVTVSYNYLHDHHKVSLNGYSDSDTALRHITYHHNVFDNVGSRTPLQRGGYSHLLNNYFRKVTTSGANIRMSGYALVEGNYFVDVKNPVTSRDSSALGFWDLRGNNVTGPADFTKFGITWTDSESTPSMNATDWKTTAAYPVALGYSYTVAPPDCVAAGLSGVAGAGKGLATLVCR